jgi:hypothetical protein
LAATAEICGIGPPFLADIWRSTSFAFVPGMATKLWLFSLKHYLHWQSLLTLDWLGLGNQSEAALLKKAHA